MAYRRRQPGFFDNSNQVGDDLDGSISNSSSSSSSSWLAAQAIRASSANRDSSLSSAYSSPLSNPSTTNTSSVSPSPSSSPSPTLLKDSRPHQYTSMKNVNESKSGFWGNLARKAKAILDDDDYGGSQQVETPERKTEHIPGADLGGKYRNTYQSSEGRRKSEGPALQKGLDAITSSLNYIGGTIGKSVEESISIVENRTAGLIQETRKHIKKKPGSSIPQNQATKQMHMQAQVQPTMQNDQELQLKASRDVAMAMAAKAKLLLRELKTVKADLAFAKERCAQLEEQNKMLSESRERGDNPEDDDLIRLQLESLLAEKARLAHENSVYARENRFLREVVEYHQLTMQDVIYLDEGTEEVTEVYPIKVVSNPTSVPSTPMFPPSPIPPEAALYTSPQVTRDVFPCPTPPPEFTAVSQSAAPPSSVSRQ